MPRTRLSQQSVAMFHGQLLDLTASGKRLRPLRPSEEFEDACNSVLPKRVQQEEQVQRVIESERVEVHPKSNQTVPKTIWSMSVLRRSWHNPTAPPTTKFPARNLGHNVLLCVYYRSPYIHAMSEMRSRNTQASREPQVICTAAEFKLN